jgi:hypothetical protein
MPATSILCNCVQSNCVTVCLQEILRPFLLVCESKNPRLIGAVLGSIQKLLAHNAVSDEGRQQIIQALHQVCMLPGCNSAAGFVTSAAAGVPHTFAGPGALQR